MQSFALVASVLLCLYGSTLVDVVVGIKSSNHLATANELLLDATDVSSLDDNVHAIEEMDQNVLNKQNEKVLEIYQAIKAMTLINDPSENCLNKAKIMNKMRTLMETQVNPIEMFTLPDVSYLRIVNIFIRQSLIFAKDCFNQAIELCKLSEHTKMIRSDTIFTGLYDTCTEEEINAFSMENIHRQDVAKLACLVEGHRETGKLGSIIRQSKGKTDKQGSGFKKAMTNMFRTIKGTKKGVSDASVTSLLMTNQDLRPVCKEIVDSNSANGLNEAMQIFQAVPLTDDMFARVQDNPSLLNPLKMFVVCSDLLRYAK